MDRKSKQKVGCFLLLLATVVVVVALLETYIYYEYELREKQLQELVIMHSDMEENLQDNFSYYQRRIWEAEIILIGAVSAVIMLSGVGLIWIVKQKERKKALETVNEMNLIYEQLLRFQSEQYEMLPAFEGGHITEKWDSIYEKLRELGYYVSDMKTRLTEEENNTKALITDISHQLKTPLASIRMCYELARSSELSADERKNFLEMEEQEIIKMEVLLEELVKLSRLENNMIQIKQEKDSLKQTISEAVSLIYMKAYAKNIEICVEQESDVEIKHDRKWTVEAFVNVLENAVKYSEAATTIMIRVSYLPSNVLIDIEDEGMGIQEEELHNIFKRFYRGNRAKEQVKEGAGVGLYLTRSIIEQQGGTIIAKRKHEGGTIFRIMLPL